MVVSQSGADYHVLRMSVIAHINMFLFRPLMTGECAFAAWKNSLHANMVDVTLNLTNTLVTGCLRPTPVQKARVLTRIEPSNTGRWVAATVEKTKREPDITNPLYGGIISREADSNRGKTLCRQQLVHHTSEHNPEHKHNEEVVKYPQAFISTPCFSFSNVV